jgi:two-component system, OmpR family, phosphate regulon sensor histidine kinase PhoR
MRRKTRVVWHLSGWFLGIVVVVVVAASWHARITVESFSHGETVAALADMGRLVVHELAGVNLDDTAAVDALCKHLGSTGGTRFTVVLPSGQVIGDSAEAPAALDNHADRPELRAAFAGGVGTSVRYSHTLQADMMYVALPLTTADRVVGAVRTARPLSQLRTSLAAVQRAIVVTGVAVGLLAAAGSLVAARRLARPIEELRRGAERFAGGDLAHRIWEPDVAELGDLARAMNQMAGQLAAHVADLTRQRNELEAILRSMAEGVVAVDRSDRLITANRAALALLGIAGADVHGRPLQELVRNPALGKLVAQAVRQPEPVSGEVLVHGETGPRHLQVHGSSLGNDAAGGAGVVLVLEDVTRLRRLEQVRRDFVANVSHELRTPITSLKGFVETLLDGAMREPETAERFLRIVLKQADRLHAIVSDLLLLAQMEQTEEGRGDARPDLRPTRLAEVLQAAVSACQPKAARRAIPVDVTCPETLQVTAEPRLLEQAVANLLDNAINYSEPGRPVAVVGRRQEDEVLIEVRDRGCGIAPEHLPRIFERFYRVDKARSREAGGTGLGLAIVKHMVQLHGGSVTVVSEAGEGSVFTIHLPVRNRQDGRT